MKQAILAELYKGYLAKTVSNLFCGIGQDGAREALEAVGGQYLERRLVQNWRQKLNTT